MWEFELKGVGDFNFVYGYFIFILAFGIECENRWSLDLGNLLLASNGDSGNLQNCWCLEWCFSVRSSEPCWNQWFNNNMSFVKSYQNYYQFLLTLVSYRLAKKVTPDENDASNLPRPCFGCHCGNESSFFPVMFNISGNFLKLPFYWYQYWYVCAIW